MGRTGSYRQNEKNARKGERVEKDDHFNGWSHPRDSDGMLQD